MSVKESTLPLYLQNDKSLPLPDKLRVVVSIRGGMITAVYGDEDKIDLIVVDHDNAYDDKFLLYYEHEDCEATAMTREWATWSEVSAHVTNSRCPDCGVEIEPYQVDDNPDFNSGAESWCLVPLARMSETTKDAVAYWDQLA